MSLRGNAFDLEDLQRELDVTASYLQADSAASQSALRRSLTGLRTSIERGPESQSARPAESISQSRTTTNTGPETMVFSQSARVTNTSSRSVPRSDVPPSYESSRRHTLEEREPGRDTEKERERERESESGSVSSSGRYSSAQDREELIQRLLSDYNSRKERKERVEREESTKKAEKSERAEQATAVSADSLSETIRFTRSQNNNNNDNNNYNSTNALFANPHASVSASLLSLPPQSNEEHRESVSERVRSTVSVRDSESKRETERERNWFSPPSPSVYVPSAHSSPQDYDRDAESNATPLSVGSNSVRREREDTLFFASDLYTHTKRDANTLYMGGAEDHFLRLTASQTMDKEKEKEEKDEGETPLTLRFSAASHSHREKDKERDRYSESVSHSADDLSLSLAQTQRVARGPQPWELAMPDHPHFDTHKEAYTDTLAQQNESTHEESATSASLSFSAAAAKHLFPDSLSYTQYTHGDEGEGEPLTTLDPSRTKGENAAVFDFSSHFQAGKESESARERTIQRTQRFAARSASRGRSKSPYAATSAVTSATTRTATLRERARSKERDSRPSSASATMRPQAHVQTQRERSRSRSASVSASARKTPFAETERRRLEKEREREFLKTKEQLQREAEEEFKRTHTFTPQTSSPSHATGETPTSAPRSRDLQQRIAEMQARHRRKLEERELMRQQVEQMEMLQCTFTPTLCKQTQRINEAKRKMEEKRMRERQRSRSAERSLSSSFAQQPSSSSGASGNSVNNSAMEVSQRLHEEATHRVHYHHWLGQELEKIRLAEYTFAPTINANARDIVEEKGRDPRPLHERVVDVQREQRQHLQQLREAVLQEQKQIATFRPQIAQQSAALAEQRWMRERGEAYGFGKSSSWQNSPDGSLSGTAQALHVLTLKEEQSDIAVRLLNEGRRIAKRKQQLLFEREQQLADEMEAAPVSRGSQKIAEKSDFVRVDFDTRQKLHEERVNRRYDERCREDEEMFKNFFQPEVTKKSHKILSEKRPEVLKEDAQHRAYRMAYEEQEKMVNNRKQLEEEIYNSFTFEPALDPISQLFGRKSSIQELHENSRGKLRQELNRQRMEREINDACTFRPQINENSRRLAEPDEYEQLYERYQQEFKQHGYLEHDAQSTAESSTSSKRFGRINMKEPEKMLEEFRVKAMQREEARRHELIMREMRELEECTFQPTVYAYPPSYQPDKPIVVKGLARHLELQSLANRMKEEAAQREHEVFHVVNADKYRRPEDGLTQVEPFEFRTSERVARRQ